MSIIPCIIITTDVYNFKFTQVKMHMTCVVVMKDEIACTWHINVSHACAKK